MDNITLEWLVCVVSNGLSSLWFTVISMLIATMAQLDMLWLRPYQISGVGVG